jgi:glycerol-3-phosphate dehydrogenase
MAKSEFPMKTEVVVIGGGATGAGVVRDLALRGIEAILVERGELTSGTSGRNHGLLHSGARYAVSDPESARECIAENLILKKIAASCIENTGGYFISLPEDPSAYPDQLLRACEKIGIPAQRVPVGEMLEKEPALSPEMVGAIEVPDGAIDPFHLIRFTLAEAQQLAMAKGFGESKSKTAGRERPSRLHAVLLSMRRGSGPGGLPGWRVPPSRSFSPRGV